MQTYAFTCGDVNGIGPEICLKTFNKILPNKNYRIIYFCPANVFIDSCQIVNPGFEFIIAKNKSEIKNSKLPLTVADIGNVKIDVGQPTKTSGKISFKSIEHAYKSITGGLTSAIITSPISKTAFSLAGIDYPGHTEMLAELTNTKYFVMTFLGNEYKTAMVTIHLPLKSVSAKIDQKSLKNTLDVVIKSLQMDFKIAHPKISVLGLNPHAGEDGRIGNEEQKIILPVLKKYNPEMVEGPFVPDAYFGNKLYKNFDLTLGMYHDQVLIPFKMLCFEEGVNFTAGLPIVRTSPDHGTAFDIAWQNKASSSSMYSAFRFARSIVKSRSQYVG
jgi:4-hydroxythreonine-4-phosphate dehydrogenase